MTRAQRALAIARIVVGVAILVRTTPLVGWLHHPLLDVPPTLLGWPDEGWHLPLGPALPADVLRVLCVARTLLAAAFALGVKPRISGIGVGVIGLVVALDDVFASSHTFRLLYGSAIVLATTDCASVWALRAQPTVDVTASVAAIRWWLVSIYAWAAVAKLNAGWLSGNALALDMHDGVLRAWVADALANGAVRAGAAVGVVIAEAAVAVALAIARARLLTIAAALTIQIGFEAAASPDVFGAIIAVLLAVVAADGWPTRERNETCSNPERETGT